MNQRRVIGFDRELKLAWLDAVASRAAAGEPPEQVRVWLDDHLSDLLGGTGRGGHRGKTVTVLTRIWANVPPECVEVRDRAVKLLNGGDATDRLGLHWSMAMAVYPFFAEVAGVIGRLLVLQGEVDRQAVVRRMLESWGDRPAVSRGCRAVWTSIIGWGVLTEAARRGRYTRLDSPLNVSHEVRAVLADALVISGNLTRPSSPNVDSPALFPFGRSDRSQYVPMSGASIVVTSSPPRRSLPRP